MSHRAVDILEPDDLGEPISPSERARLLIAQAIVGQGETEWVDRLIKGLTREFELHEAERGGLAQELMALEKRCHDLLSIIREFRRPVVLQKGDNIQYLLVSLPADLAHILEVAIENTRREAFREEMEGDLVEYDSCRKCSRKAVHLGTRKCLGCGEENFVES